MRPMRVDDNNGFILVVSVAEWKLIEGEEVTQVSQTKVSFNILLLRQSRHLNNILWENIYSVTLYGIEYELYASGGVTVMQHLSFYFHNLYNLKSLVQILITQFYDDELHDSAHYVNSLGGINYLFYCIIAEMVNASRKHSLCALQYS